MKKIVVVDLDGCLCTVNTFRFWLLFSFFYLLLSFRLISLFRFSKCIILRVLGKKDRVQMKKSVLRVTEQLPQYYIDRFCRFLHMFTNQDVLSETRKYTEELVVLCTAAPAVYVNTFSESFGFVKVFSTPSVSEVDWKENIGCQKLVAIEAYYGENLTFECVISDHFDDLPLLLKANRRVLVRPSEVTLTKIADKFEFDIL